jgi:hypothetical protein
MTQRLQYSDFRRFGHRPIGAFILAAPIEAFLIGATIIGVIIGILS